MDKAMTMTDKPPIQIIPIYFTWTTGNSISCSIDKEAWFIWQRNQPEQLFAYIDHYLRYRNQVVKPRHPISVKPKPGYKPQSNLDDLLKDIEL